MSDKCVHTEHCCVEHGCKYGDQNCPVVCGTKLQSFPCQECYENPEPVSEIVKRFSAALTLCPSGYVVRAEDYDSLQSIVDTLREENTLLKSLNRTQYNNIASYQEDNAALNIEVQRLDKDNDRLTKETDDALEKIYELNKEVARLKEESIGISNLLYEVTNGAEALRAQLAKRKAMLPEHKDEETDDECEQNKN